MKVNDPPCGGDREILSIQSLSLKCLIVGIINLLGITLLGPSAREFTITCVDISTY